MLCFRTVPVAKNFMDKEGEHQRFPSINFCLTVLKNTVGESFSISVSSGIEKVWIKKEGGESHNFPSKNFCLTVPKIFLVDPLSVPLISATGKFACFKWLCRLSVEILLSHGFRKFQGNTSVL